MTGGWILGSGVAPRKETSGSCSGMRWPAAGQPVNMWMGSRSSLLTSSPCTYDRVLAADRTPCSRDTVDFFESHGAEGTFLETPSATLRSHHATLGILWGTMFRDSHTRSSCDRLDLAWHPGCSLTMRRTWSTACAEPLLSIHSGFRLVFLVICYLQIFYV